MDPNLINILRVPIQGWGKRDSSYAKRKANIEWIEHLDRTSLGFAVHERSILMYKTSLDEKLYLQYPGKESRLLNARGGARETTAVRPWDFRPKVNFSNGATGKDLSFGHIWSVLFTNSEQLARSNNPNALKVLAMLFYRMAFMVDHQSIIQTHIEQYIIENEKLLKEPHVPHAYPLFLYRPPKEALLAIPDMDWCGMSLEAFLYYNDFLAWNEDCKYYYRDNYVKKKKTWLNGTGRMNTILTHLRFMGCCLHLLPLADVFEDFSRGKGVSPASDEDVKIMCPEFII